MKTLSLNIKWMGNPSKILYKKELYRLDMIILQEK